jgi:hypothetical protein
MKPEDDIEIWPHIRCKATLNTHCVILCYVAILLLKEHCIQNAILYRQETGIERGGRERELKLKRSAVLMTVTMTPITF